MTDPAAAFFDEREPLSARERAALRQRDRVPGGEDALRIPVRADRLQPLERRRPVGRTQTLGVGPEDEVGVGLAGRPPRQRPSDAGHPATAAVVVGGLEPGRSGLPVPRRAAPAERRGVLRYARERAAQRLEQDRPQRRRPARGGYGGGRDRLAWEAAQEAAVRVRPR